MAVDIMDEIAIAQRSYELSKYSDNELQAELDMRTRMAEMELSEALYKMKDVIDFDDDGRPFNTETL